MPLGQSFAVTQVLGGEADKNVMALHAVHLVESPPIVHYPISQLESQSTQILLAFGSMLR